MTDVFWFGKTEVEEFKKVRKLENLDVCVTVTDAGWKMSDVEYMLPSITDWKLKYAWLITRREIRIRVDIKLYISIKVRPVLKENLDGIGSNFRRRENGWEVNLMQVISIDSKRYPEIPWSASKRFLISEMMPVTSFSLPYKGLKTRKARQAKTDDRSTEC